MRCFSRISACRRGLNSHEAAKPRERHCPQKSRRAKNQTTLPQQPSRVRLSTTANKNDMELPCQIERAHCVGSSGVQSVRRVAATSSAASSLAQFRRLLEYAARHGQQRGAGSSCGRPRGVTRPWQAKHQRSPSAAQPNPSLKARPNGGSPGPVWRYAVHFRQSGPGAPPSVPP